MSRLLRLSLVSVLAVLLSGAPLYAQQAIFRHIIIVKGEKIILGAPLSAAARSLGSMSGEDRFELRAGTFGGARSITLQIDQDGRVGAIFFDYGAAMAYAAMVASYRKLLGDPALQRGNGKDGVTAWQDAQTILEVESRHSIVTVAMYDRRLAKR